jgi:hypothetical protein
VKYFYRLSGESLIGGFDQVVVTGLASGFQYQLTQTPADTLRLTALSGQQNVQINTATGLNFPTVTPLQRRIAFNKPLVVFGARNQKEIRDWSRDGLERQDGQELP